MRVDKAKTIWDALHKTCKENLGKQVFVRGMWCGDFIGTVMESRFTTAQFRVDRSMSKADDAPLVDDMLWLPFGEYMTLEPLTPPPQALEQEDIPLEASA